MSYTSLRVIARVAAKADRVEQVRTILMGVVEPTRREPGCLGYQLL
jgi:quinol monooxygenase YgiN